MSLSFVQVIQLKLSPEQKMFLRQYEKVLREKIHGPKIKSEKIPNPAGGDFLKFRRSDDNSSTFIECISKEEIDQEILKMNSRVTPSSLYRKDTKLYLHILHYYGSLSSGFSANGREFSNSALEEWQTSVVEFLGILPDTWIGKIVGKRSATIQAFRSNLGIASFVENLSEDENKNKEEILRIQADNVEKLKNFREAHGSKQFLTPVKDQIRAYIQDENNTGKSDDAISKELKEKGINVSRRTVNKHRLELTRGVIQ